ncbi:MAG: TraX family protein [Erysipelotrichaceae bacterium]|nr:TraX family protein [Erysipelotrichaceae bacterium]
MKRYQLLDGTMLKIIAMISMVFDHAGDIFFPGLMWPRMAGRLAMPIFSFCIAEGFAHTHDQKKYLMRIGMFALISEIPFDLAFEGKIGLGHQNIMLTYFLSVIGLMLFERIRGGQDTDTEHIPAGKTVLGVFTVLAIAVLSLLLRADYTVFAVISVFLFYVLRNKHPLIRSGVGVAFLALTRTMNYYCTTGLSFIPLAMYNGKRGKGLKWLFYVFYPGHLLLLAAVRYILHR